MSHPLRIGTRKSPLAQWQARHVASLLAQHGLQATLVTMESLGDKDLKKNIPDLGSQGVFTAELEAALRLGEVDLAVHSAKDLPAETPADLPIVAFTEREEVHDVLVSHLDKLDTTKPLVIGTASTRRKALLHRYVPAWQTVVVRGNLQTRLAKMESGVCDVLFLAAAGVKRSGFQHLVKKNLPTRPYTPMAGQGSLAVQVHQRLDPTLRHTIATACTHPDSQAELLTERAYLRTLQGGCSIPSFALARSEKGRLHAEAGLVALDGSHEVRCQAEAPVAEADQLGLRLAEMVLERGGAQLLDSIKRQLAKP